MLVREAAELRRQLGQVVDVIGQGTVLSPHQHEVLGQPLADAVTYRDPAWFCQDHADDLDKTDAYLALGRSLGIEVDR